MTLVSGLLNQTAVYWAGPVPDGFGGFEYNDPVEIACRWQNSSDLVVTPDGETKPDAVQVWSTTAMVVGGMLYLGTLAELSSAEEGDPETVSGARRISNVAVGRNIDGVVDHYKATI